MRLDNFRLTLGALLLTLLGACSFSDSSESISTSFNNALESISNSFNAMSNSSSGGGESASALYLEDVRAYTEVFAVQGGSAQDFSRGLSDVAERHGITDWEAEPATPGSVHIRGGYPFRILAVVHDLSLDPTWRAEWIELALRRSLEVAREEGLQAVGIEPLGAVHGRFPVADFDNLLGQIVADDPEPPLDLWRIELQR